MSKSFKETLRDELDYQGLTVKELAAKAGLVKGSIDSYLGVRQSIPTADIAVRIAKALGVSVEYLITGEMLNTSIPQVISKGYAEYLKYRDIIDLLNKLPSENLANVKPFLLSTIEVELKKVDK